MSHTTDLALRQRARRVIPGGMYGHMAIGPRMPADYPQFFSRAEGARLWDADGHEYIDYLCAYGPMIVGYGNRRVGDRAQAQRTAYDIGDGPAQNIVELAERLVGMIGHADWAVFSKNGNDATTTCVMAARAYRGRTKVLVAEGAYHGSQPWANRRAPGSPPGEHDAFPTYTFNDSASLERAVREASPHLAGIMVSAFRHDAGSHQELVDPDFARTVRRLCDQQDAALILDDVRAGFRLSLDASWSAHGIEPDLSAWGKALGNGEPIAATLGSERFREAMQSVFVTGSFWYQAAPMAAALETLDILTERDAPSALEALGTRLRDGIDDIARLHNERIRQSGPPQMPTIMFEDDPKFARGFAFCSALIKRGVYFHPWHNMFLSLAHTVEDIDRTLEAVDGALAEMR
jgi:glutamate-1-semialdehyde 2,1-aminomutase